jgi:hypothetical protein
MHTHKALKILAVAAAVLDLGCRGPESSSLLNSKIRCAEVGRKWFEGTERRQAPHGEQLTNPQFVFDRLHETCLCYYHLTYNGQTTDAVADVLTDKDVLIWRPDLHGIDARKDPPGRIHSAEEFNRRIADLGFQP